LSPGGAQAGRRGIHPVRLEHDARVHHGAGGARVHARSDDRRVPALASRHPDARDREVLQREREQLEPLDAGGAARRGGVQERRRGGADAGEERALHRLARRRHPPQPHLGRDISLSRRHQVVGREAPSAVRGGAARAGRGAGGGCGNRRAAADSRPRAEEPAPADPALHRQQGRRRLRLRDSLHRVRSRMTDRKTVYGPEDWGGDLERDLAAPGAFPFTRGVHPTMYRGKLWTMRQYAGFGTAEETNARFRHLLAAGQTGLSVAFDLPTQMGYDSDHPMAEGEVGRAGVAIDTVDDLERLFHEIPLDKVSTSMTINATAPILLAMYLEVGEEQGVEAGKLQRAVGMGLDVNTFASRLSFFFAAFSDLFEEVAKFRAARRLWARLMKEKFQADEAACRLRFHTQTGGSTLTAQQPRNNVVRVAI